jgi:hypothetical protein
MYHDSDTAAAAEFTVAPSIISVLTTAVPSSVLSDITNPSLLPGWVSDLGSSLAAGQTPGWLSSVPPNIETYFATAIAAAAAATATGTDAVASGSAVAVGVLGLALAL